MKRRELGKPKAQGPRFRILSGSGGFLGWIHRRTIEEALQDAKHGFRKDLGITIEFLEEDQD